MDLLIDAGVPAVLFHSNAIGGLGELPVTYPEVWIKRNEDENKSQRVIHRFELSSSESMTKQNDLVCQQCLEENPASFKVCWKCASILPLT